MKHVYTVGNTVTIDGVEVEVLGWDVQVGLAGQIGSANIYTSRVLLKNSGLRLSDLSATANAKIVEIKAKTKGNEQVLIFGGYHDHAETRFNNGIITFFAADYASILVNTKDVIADMNYRNRTPSQIATQIAQKFGFNPIVTDTPGAPPMKVGQLLKEDTTFNPQPTEMWRILQYLAQTIAFDCYVTPSRDLVFGPPNTKLKPLEVTWKGGEEEENTSILEISVTDRPRRNANFSVRIFSYSHGNSSQSDARTIVVDQDILKSSGPTGQSGGVLFGSIGAKVVRAGTYWGPDAALIAKQIKEEHAEAPEYVFRINGLSVDQAQRYALSYAKDIGRRSLTATVIIEGDPTLSPQQRVILREGEQGALDDYADRNLEIYQVAHRYDCHSQGFTTELSLVAIPPGATDDAANAVNTP